MVLNITQTTKFRENGVIQTKEKNSTTAENNKRTFDVSAALKGKVSNQAGTKVLKVKFKPQNHPYPLKVTYQSEDGSTRTEDFTEEGKRNMISPSKYDLHNDVST